MRNKEGTTIYNPANVTDADVAAAVTVVIHDATDVCPQTMGDIFEGLFDGTKLPGELIANYLDNPELNRLLTTSRIICRSLKAERKESLVLPMKKLTMKVKEFRLNSQPLIIDVLSFTGRCIFTFMGLLGALSASRELFSSSSKPLNQSPTDIALVIGVLIVALTYYCSLLFKSILPLVGHCKNRKVVTTLSQIGKRRDLLNNNTDTAIFIKGRITHTTRSPVAGGGDVRADNKMKSL